MAAIVSPPGAMTSGTGANQAWQRVRADSDIQFAPVEIAPVAPAEPGWLQRLSEWLGDLLAPLGEMLGIGWPVLRWVLLAIAVGLALLLAWRILEPVLARMGRQRGAQPPQWHPERTVALALLEDADALAAQGRFDEATHLLLLRSVGQIAQARPDWVEPSSTARELADLSHLPHAARGAFRAMAERVERSRFALRRLDAADWSAARAAYADFALVALPAEATA